MAITMEERFDLWRIAEMGIESSDLRDDYIALVTNDIRKLFIERGIDPMGATEFERGIYRAIDIMAQAVQGGDIAAYGRED